MAQEQTIDLGVFLPIANNGFLLSTGGPQYPPTFELNAAIARRCEEIGFDFVLSQTKWRGFGGETRFWDVTLDSLTLTAGLAAVTERIGVLASVQPLLTPPAAAAKMVATIDDISGGRAGLNVVAGSYLAEYEQMGLMPRDFAEYRYDYASEWTELVRRLWSEPSVDHAGRFFQLEDCRSDPKPLQRPHPPIVGAGSSESGMEFVARHCSHAFIPTPDMDFLRKTTDRYREAAAAVGRSVRIYTVFQAVLASSDAEAAALIDRWVAAADDEAIAAVLASYTRKGSGESTRRFVTANPTSIFFGSAVPGSPGTIADHIERLARQGGVDGVLLCFPDWMTDLDVFASDVMPILADRGLIHEPVRFGGANQPPESRPTR